MEKEDSKEVKSIKDKVYIELRELEYYIKGIKDEDVKAICKASLTERLRNIRKRIMEW